MSELQLKISKVMHELNGLCPSTSEEERQKGYNKFEMGAILVRDGFTDYGRLDAADRVMQFLSKGPMSEVADRQLLDLMERFGTKVKMFCDIMEDLGLFTLMKKSQEFKNCPVEPPPTLSQNRSTPYAQVFENEPKVKEEPSSPIAPKRAPMMKRSASDRFEFSVLPIKQKIVPKPVPVAVSDDEDKKGDPTAKKLYNYNDFYHGNGQDWRVSKPQEKKAPTRSVPARSRSAPLKPRPLPSKEDRSTPYAISNNKMKEAGGRSRAQTPPRPVRPVQAPSKDESLPSPRQDRSTPYFISNPKDENDDASSKSSEDTPEEVPPAEELKSVPTSHIRPEEAPVEQSKAQSIPVNNQEQVPPKQRKSWFGRSSRREKAKPEPSKERSQSVPPEAKPAPLPPPVSMPTPEKEPITPEFNESAPPPPGQNSESHAESMPPPSSSSVNSKEKKPTPRKGWFKPRESKRAQSVPPARPVLHEENHSAVPKPRDQPKPEMSRNMEAPPAADSQAQRQEQYEKVPPPEPEAEISQSMEAPPVADDQPKMQEQYGKVDEPTPDESTIADSTKAEPQSFEESNNMSPPPPIPMPQQQAEEEGEGDGDADNEMYTAAVVDYAGAPLRLEQRPIPTPGKGQVLIRVVACGICHSDSYTCQGTFPGVEFPRVPGHELTGRVVSLGPEVEWPQPDTMVGVGWHGGHCLVCKVCRSGRFMMCEKANITGIHLDGGYQEYCLAHWTSVIELPKRFDPLRDAPLLGAAVAIFQSLHKETDARPGDVVAIQGIGGIGHIGIQLARKMGYRVVAISTNADKEKEALDLGAHLFIGPKSKSVTRKLQKLGGAKLIISTAPTSEVLGALVPGLGLNGRLVTMGLDMGGAGSFGLSPNNLIFNHGQILGLTPGKPYDAEEACEFAILQDVECVTEIFPLEQAQEAFDRMMSGKARYRVVLKIADR
eukprot:CAMPEP_0172447216 /NCGR_PEP_ID=MMETSP1065-20121228/6570_1 /TAXON_ID=265537 /ORGANISM="Amphiprora paludosa, Strain CCMP125" /LENGTH=940 /DNA_ID=CAMNT_0013198459 /DNA_START=25 /DNA_END=2847 /DNA_ORIENTATION=+